MVEGRLFQFSFLRGWFFLNQPGYSSLSCGSSVLGRAAVPWPPTLPPHRGNPGDGTLLPATNFNAGETHTAVFACSKCHLAETLPVSASPESPQPGESSWPMEMMKHSHVQARLLLRREGPPPEKLPLLPALHTEQGIDPSSSEMSISTQGWSCVIAERGNKALKSLMELNSSQLTVSWVWGCSICPSSMGTRKVSLRQSIQPSEPTNWTYPGIFLLFQIFQIELNLVLLTRAPFPLTVLKHPALTPPEDTPGPLYLFQTHTPDGHTALQRASLQHPPSRLLGFFVFFSFEATPVMKINAWDLTESRRLITLPASFPAKSDNKLNSHLRWGVINPGMLAQIAICVLLTEGSASKGTWMQQSTSCDWGAGSKPMEQQQNPNKQKEY